MKLEKDQILKHAFILLNEVGIDKFNMRKLAENLGVSATALYWHYKNKNQLMEAMVGQIYATAYMATQDCTRWQDHLFTLGKRLKKELEMNRDSVKIIAAVVPTDTNNLDMSRKGITSQMAEDGLDIEEAWQFVSITISFVLGWMSYYQNQKYRKYLASRFNFEESFKTGLDSLITGFENISPRNLMNERISHSR